MESLRPVFWGQGMFLQPQHFQQQDRYHEARLQRYLRLHSPYFWGIQSLVIDESALQTFVFSIQECIVVTREGALLTYHHDAASTTAPITQRAIEGALDPGGDPLGIYVGIKRLQWEESNVGARNGSRDGEMQTAPSRRYSLYEQTTPDIFAEPTSGNRELSLQYLLYDVRLFIGDEARHAQDHELIKIAEVVQAAEGQGAVLSRQYVPPCLFVHASPVLVGMLREIRDMLTAKGRELADYIRQRRIQAIAMGSRDTVYFLMMQTVNRYIPLFHHHLEIEGTHPREFYAFLRQLIGELSTFVEDISVLGGPLPPYRHDQLWIGFEAAARVAKDLISALSKGPEYVVPLVFDGEYFAAELDRGFFEGSNRYYLSIKVDMPPREVERLLTGTGKVCTHEQMETLRQRALPGLIVQYVESPPEELPRRALCYYFELDHHSPLWQQIEQRQDIAVYCQIPPQETDMQLLVVSES